MKLHACKLFFIGLLGMCFAQAEASYSTDGLDCDGYKRVLVGTDKGMCMGLVAQAAEYSFVKPRRIIQVPNKKQFLITDMGGWGEHQGILWLLDVSRAKPKLLPLLEKLNLPHGLAIDDKGRFYIGEKHQIIRVALKNGAIDYKETVVKGLPNWKGHRHPLTHFIFDKDQNLIVNTAAPSDQCKKTVVPYKACGEFDQNGSSNASIRVYFYDKKYDRWSANYKVIASGLRNSLALVQHESGTLLQAENSMDFKGLHKPFEEINIIRSNRFYGWPYCYDQKTVNPFWATSAKKYCLSSPRYKEPWVLIPPHSAPLDMLYYNGDKFPKLRGKLILSYHGYRATGHRIVAYDVDEQGRPKRSATASYFVDPIGEGRNTSFKSTPFPVNQPAAQGKELVNAWNAIANVRPIGRPAGMTVAEDGSIWVLDDVNKAVLRLSTGKAVPQNFGMGSGPSGTLVKEKNVADLIQLRCAHCHPNIKNNNETYLPNSWLGCNAKKQLLEVRMFESVLPQMPLDRKLDAGELAVFKDWIIEHNRCAD